jgi:membrane associated rhomboid family serine protease
MTSGGYYIEHPASYGLIAAFVMIFIAGLNDSSLSYRLMLSTYNIKHRKEWYRLFSVGLVHGGWMHLLLNVLGIYFFGTLVEYLAGSVMAMGIFLASVLGGSLFSWFIRRGDTDYQAVGASGGVMGLLMCAVMWFDGIQLSLFLIPVGIPGWIFVIIFNIGSIAMSQSADRNRISHEGHLGGALIGGMIGYFFTPQVPLTHSWWAFWLGTFPILLFAIAHGLRPRWFK